SKAVANLGRQYELQCQIERRLESATNPATPATYRLHVVDRNFPEELKKEREWQCGCFQTKGESAVIPHWLGDC
ncbi:hypothetical protein J6590_070741, partial [Homalodisca vitripennis]